MKQCKCCDCIDCCCDGADSGTVLVERDFSSFMSVSCQGKVLAFGKATKVVIRTMEDW